MVPTNSLLQRWVLASVAKHLHDAAEAIELPLVVEQVDLRGDDFKTAPAKAEATITGPHTRELSPDERETRVSVFLKVATDGQHDENALNHADRCGVFQNALDKCILIHKHAVGEVDPELVGELLPDSEQEIQVTHLAADDGTQLVHSVIEAFYVGFLP